jgi:hypothetical protein
VRGVVLESSGQRLSPHGVTEHAEDARGLGADERILSVVFDDFDQEGGGTAVAEPTAAKGDGARVRSIGIVRRRGEGVEPGEELGL